jgi:hypothetical protein
VNEDAFAHAEASDADRHPDDHIGCGEQNGHLSEVKLGAKSHQAHPGHYPIDERTGHREQDCLGQTLSSTGQEEADKCAAT